MEQEFSALPAPVGVAGGDVAVVRPEMGPEMVGEVSPWLRGSEGESGSMGSGFLSFSTGSRIECSLNRWAGGIRLT